MFGRGTELEQVQADLQQAHDKIAALEAERAAMFSRDVRTGLLSLDAFRSAANRELDRAKRSGTPISLVLVDIDGFRDLNSRHGAAAGDSLLKAVAEHVMSVSRSTDLMGRTGADELAILLCDAPLDGAVALAQRVVDLVAGTPSGDMGILTISAGATQHVRGGTLETLLGGAGEGVDIARGSGGGRVCVPESQGNQELTQHADVVDALATTLSERDRYTGEHSESVVEMACAVAVNFGLDEREVHRIGQAALLHDIGKVAIPDHILNKPAKLTDEEWILMREHPVIGERILQAIPGMGGVARIVRHEHESFDGSGYPDGLQGDAIPLGSRIILACDTYHAITSDRPYRARQSHQDAVLEIVRCAGTQFDPHVTERLIGFLHAQHQRGLLV